MRRREEVEVESRMGYFVRKELGVDGEVTRRGPFVTEQEARMVFG